MIKKLFFVAILFLFVSCSVKVKTLYDHSVNFTGYKSFCWLKGCEFIYTGPNYLMTPEAKNIFQQAIIDQMKSKGIVYDDNNPDLLVDIHITVNDETFFVYPHDEDEEWLSRLYGQQQQPKEITLLKGTLILDIVEKKSGRMIWRSVATSYLDRYPGTDEKSIKRGIALVLKKFPPKPVSIIVEK